MRLPLATATVALALAAGVASAAPTESEMGSISAARDEYRAARRQVDRRDYAGAIATLRRAEALDPQNADVQNLLGFAHRESGEVFASLAFYERALALDPSHLGALEYMGRAYLFLGQVDKAREHLARLEAACDARCPERDALRRAIAEWSPWRTSLRTGARTY